MRLPLLLCAVAGATLAFAQQPPPTSVNPTGPPPLRVGVEFNSPPLSFLPDPAAPAFAPSGFTVDLLREIERVSPLRFELVPKPWTRLLADFETKDLDMLANVLRTDARRDTMAFTNPHGRVHGVIYTRRDRPRLRRTSEFAGRSLGTLAGSVAHVNALKNDGWGATVEPFSHWELAFEATAKGENDGTLLLSPMSSSLRNQNELRSDLVEDIIHPYRFALHPGSHAAVADLNDALALLAADGTLDRLVRRWIGPIEPRPIRLTDLRPYLWPTSLGLILLTLALWWQHRALRRATRTTAALRRTTQLLNASQNIAQVGGWDVNLVSGELFWSEGTCRIHEVAPDYLPSLDHAFEFYPPLARAKLTAVWEAAVQRGESYDLELELITARQRRILVQTIGVPTIERGRTLRVTGAIRDITQLKQAERDRLQLSKIEATSILVGGLAHDFNNLFTIIGLNLGLAHNPTTPPAEFARRLTAAGGAVTAAQKLIRQLLAFARGATSTPSPVDLAPLARTTVAEALQNSPVRAEFTLPATLGPILGNANQIQQLFHHISLNAREAMPEGGLVRVTGGLTSPDSPPPPELPNTPGVYLSITDYGPGIEPDLLARVFDPYFSTKNRGTQKGMGLGLSISHAIVQDHQGVIAVKSVPDRGTTVFLWFPLARLDSPPPLNLSRSPAGENGTVPVV